MTWHCPAGHPISAADRFDMWCEDCGGDVIAIADQAADPPEYQPDEDEMAARWAAAMQGEPPR